MDVSERQELFCIKWEKRRKRKWRYILITALSWGVVLTLSNSFTSYILHNEIPSLKKLFISLLIFGIGGIYMGWIFFNQREKSYRDIKSDLENEC